ncbi:hypothetical protein [Rhodoferax antarcticus]|uniref:Uncharacterized protein n=1 Tax=Rhodoferax antarcticus ANT.BR TaxID=1111071 RepID=A0A1Q8Y9L2_9BURK|nr:hypothetical protein [Rhodoferax antarcticus]OLP04627.1 hypothetical protein BLL52_4267 [Rhodoferax antarcticus ANT.BR]
MYINHVTLSTGHTARTSRADVTDETIKTLSPWLDAALAHKDDYPLPGTLGARDGYVMSASLMHGGLVCHVGQLESGPLVSFAVAKRSRQSGELWAWMCAQYGSRAGLTAPGTPWCAVALRPSFALQHGSSAWIGDFERCVAWTWLER